MRVLMIGNSFLAALKQGFELNSLDVTFLGGTGNYLLTDLVRDSDGTLRLSNEAQPIQHEFWRMTLGSDRPLRLEDYDRIIVVGLIPPPNPWRLDSCFPGSEENLRRRTGQAPMSFALYREVSQNRYMVQRTAQFLDMLQDVNLVERVLFLPYPHIRDDAHSFKAVYEIPAHWTRLSEQEKSAFTENENRLYVRLFKAEGATVYLSPKELVIEGNRCPARYSEGALGSKNFQPGVAPQWGSSPVETEMNYSHKNAEYGRVWWKHLATLLRPQGSS